MKRNVKLKSFEEILAAKKPRDIFSMNAETLEKERDAYLEKYKPKDYEIIRNSIISQKITLFYYDAIDELCNSSKNTSSSFDAINTLRLKSNFEIIDSILKESQKVVNDFYAISTGNSAQSLEEYYMLQKEISNFESSLTDMSYLKKAYEEITISIVPSICIDDTSLIMVASMSTLEALALIKSICAQKYISPLNVIREFICDNGLSNYDTNNYRIYSIYHIGGITLPDCFYDLQDFHDLSGEYCLYDSLGKEIASYERRYLHRKQILIEEGEGKGSYYSMNVYKLTFNKKDAIALLDYLYHSHYSSQIVCEETYQKYVDLKNFIITLNYKIQLNNLRSIYSELKRILRKYKLQEQIL